jgi:cell division protein FtsX
VRSLVARKAGITYRVQWTLGCVLAASLLIAASTARGESGNDARRRPEEVAPQQLAPARADATLFMDVNATEDQIAGARKEIMRSRFIRRFAFVSKDDAVAEVRGDTQFEGVDASQLPTSFRMIVIRPASVLQLQAIFHSLPGVDELMASPPIQRRQQEQRRRCGERGQLQVFVQIGSDDEAPNIEKALQSFPEVQSARFVSHRESRRRFACIFAHTNLVDSASERDLPESFDVELKPNADAEALIARVRALAGVDDIRTTLEAPPYATS